MPNPRFAIESWFFGGSALPGRLRAARRLAAAGASSACREPVLEPQDSPGHPLAPVVRGRPRAAPRALRRARKPRPRRRRALITMVHNEPVFLPIWLRYYSRFFAPEDIYVLDNDIDRRLDRARRLRAHPGRRTTPSTTPGWSARSRRLQHELLERYDVVLVTDVDEIVAPVPGVGHARRLPRPLRRGVGQLPRLRAAARAATASRRCDLDRARSSTSAGTGSSTTATTRPALATVPMTWKPGFHGRADQQLQPRPRPAADPPAPDGLRHLPRAPPRCASASPGPTRTTREGWAVHNRLAEDAEFDRWFTRGRSVPGDRRSGSRGSPSRGAGCSERALRRARATGCCCPRRRRAPSSGSACR